MLSRSAFWNTEIFVFYLTASKHRLTWSSRNNKRCTLSLSLSLSLSHEGNIPLCISHTLRMSLKALSILSPLSKSFEFLSHPPLLLSFFLLLSFVNSNIHALKIPYPKCYRSINLSYLSLFHSLSHTHGHTLASFDLIHLIASLGHLFNRDLRIHLYGSISMDLSLFIWRRRRS